MFYLTLCYRINSVKNLGTIAVALGPERTRSDLLNYILGNFYTKVCYIALLDLMDDEEEVLLALAETLGNFVDYVGGANHAIHIIGPLERLCQVEETAVREKVKSIDIFVYINQWLKATEGIKKIISIIKVKDIESKLVEMIKRMMSGEGYTSKFPAT